MRKLIRIIILGIVISVTWKYLDENDISVKEKVFDGLEWLRVKVDEARVLIGHEAGDYSFGSSEPDSDRPGSLINARRYSSDNAFRESIHSDTKDHSRGREQENTEPDDMSTPLNGSRSSSGTASARNSSGVERAAIRMRTSTTASKTQSGTTLVNKNTPAEQAISSAGLTAARSPAKSETASALFISPAAAPVATENVNPSVKGLMDIDNVFDWVKEATRLYSPDSWYLLMQYDGLPQRMESKLNSGRYKSSGKTAGTFHYLKGNTRTELLYRMSTNVHEIAHGYYGLNVYMHENNNGMITDWHDVTGYIYVSPGESYYISFPGGSLFASRMIADRIPAKLRPFRFNTYITGTTSTQSEGVLGLLDELHAYFLDSKYHLDMLEAYRLAEGIKERGVIEWIRHGCSTMAALFEFDFFIKEYLLLMRERYPDDYIKLSEYKEFSYAYAAVRFSYEEVVSLYFRTIESEMDRINKSGSYMAEIIDGYFWVTELKSGSSKGIRIISEDKDKLLPVLKSDRYREVERDFAVVFPERNIYSKY